MWHAGIHAHARDDAHGHHQMVDGVPQRIGRKHTLPGEEVLPSHGVILLHLLHAAVHDVLISGELLPHIGPHKLLIPLDV